MYFYPRSPCGERLVQSTRMLLYSYFYPRSPCGERRHRQGLQHQPQKFLSTLSLRRATAKLNIRQIQKIISIHALLAESDRIASTASVATLDISIHALLAESDGAHYDNYNLHCVISIHALLAESDHLLCLLFSCTADFYPRSPCGERPVKGKPASPVIGISIHALLAESDPYMENAVVRDC